MTQTVTLTISLGAARTGQAIGYRVLQIDNSTVYSAFTTTGVTEAPASSGDYHVANGVIVPDAGGYIVVGVSGTDYKKAGVDPSPAVALGVDTYAEPSSVPAATASLTAKIGWLYALARNKLLVASGTQTLRNDGDSGTIATSSVSDDGTTFTTTKWS